ncbi:sphingosine 1-phosphate receptor 5b [Erpetoichthys calabaricus]|uniref:Sphingosine-1-phosphate receptor 5a n=1 Tax=Erpetoichthys calabaricus TaxID=27687 RepID=A0A8C4T960_ERPCA|nr:sphingosine 1-phosphate receptor 5b [Erpetoichthys calabaricus]
MSNSRVYRFFREYQNNSVITLHYNFTGKLGDNKYSGGLKVEAICLLVICVFIVFENFVVLLAIWKNKKFHLPMYYLLGNLTLSDLLAGIAYMINILMSGSNTLKLTPVLWFIREGGVFVTLAASVISLLAIAIERHITMIKLKFYQRDKKWRMFALIAASWALSVFLGILPILGWNCIDDLEGCSTVLPLYAKSYILFCVTVLNLILISIIFLYVGIYRIVKVNSQRLGNLRKGMSKKSQKYMALLKTFTIVVGTFIVCWLPLFILFILDFSCKVQKCPILYKADYFLGIAMLNSLLNPIIYTLTSKDMRKAILKLLCRRCLMTEDGQVNRFGIPFLDCNTSKTDKSSYRVEGIDSTVSSGNVTPSPIKAFLPNMSRLAKETLPVP